MDGVSEFGGGLEKLDPGLSGADFLSIVPTAKSWVYSSYIELTGTHISRLEEQALENVESADAWQRGRRDLLSLPKNTGLGTDVKPKGKVEAGLAWTCDVSCECPGLVGCDRDIPMIFFKSKARRTGRASRHNSSSDVCLTDNGVRRCGPWT